MMTSIEFVLSKKYSFFGKSLSVLFFYLFVFQGLFAQMRTTSEIVEQSRIGENCEKFYFEVRTFPVLTSADSIQYMFLFKIRNDVISFEIGNKNNSDVYISIPKLRCEFLDEDNIVVRTLQWSDSIITKNFEETTSPFHYVYGVLTTTSKRSNFSFHVEVFDQNNISIINYRTKPIIAKSLNLNPQIGEPIYSFTSENDSVYPMCSNSEVPFGKDFRIIVPISEIIGAKDEFRYTIHRLQDSKNENITGINTDTFSDNTEPQRNISLVVGQKIQQNDMKLIKKYITSNHNLIVNQGNRLNYGLLDIYVHGRMMLNPGKYELKIYRIQEGKIDSSVSTFTVVWYNKPLSLKRINYAISILSYIASQDEIDEIASGSDAEKKDKLYAFWKNKDDVPNTINNEKMSEYYSRVDEAYLRFSLLSQKDGAKTEQGRIFILFGKPDSIARELKKDNKISETWIYTSKIRKKVTFEVGKNGFYEVSSISE